MMTTSIEAGDSTTILERKVKAFEEFLAVTELLHRELGDEEMGMVTNRLERREELIRHIDEMDRLHARQRHSAVGGDRRGELLRRLRDTMERIRRIDQECSARVASGCEMVRRELELIRRHDKGLHAYGGKKELLPRFLDLQT